MALDPLALASLTALRVGLPGHAVEVRRTRRSLVGLRRHPELGLVLRVHPEVLNDAECPVSITEWVRRRGRGGAGDALKGLLQRTAARMAARSAEMAGGWAVGLATVGDRAAADLHTVATRIHADWFADLPPVPVSWGRRPPRRRLTHLRFGCYRRQRRCIEISPRLAEPWVAAVFLEHVVHHEYCHHRQAVTPPFRREGVHSPRFRAWERSFTGYDEARRWEQLALPWLLDGSPPPWYRAQRSQP